MKSETFPKCAIKLLVFNFVLTCVFPLRQPINYTYLESLWTQSQFNFFIFTAFFSFERSYRSYKMKTELSHCQSFLNVARVKIIHWGLFHKWLFKKKNCAGAKVAQQVKLFAMQLFQIQVAVQVQAAPLPIQLCAIAPKAVAEGGPSTLSLCYLCEKSGWRSWFLASSVEWISECKVSVFSSLSPAFQINR